MSDFPVRSLTRSEIIYISVPEFKPFRIPDIRVYIFDLACVCEEIKYDNPVIRIFPEDILDETASYESGAAGYQNCLHQGPFFLFSLLRVCV